MGWIEPRGVFGVVTFFPNGSVVSSQVVVESFFLDFHIRPFLWVCFLQIFFEWEGDLEMMSLLKRRVFTKKLEAVRLSRRWHWRFRAQNEPKDSLSRVIYLRIVSGSKSDLVLTLQQKQLSHLWSRLRLLFSFSEDLVEIKGKTEGFWHKFCFFRYFWKSFSPIGQKFFLLLILPKSWLCSTALFPQTGGKKCPL